VTRNDEQRRVQGKSLKRDLGALLVTVLAAATLVSLFPDKRHEVLESAWKFLIEMALVLPAVMLLMGLFNVFVPKDAVVKYLGRAAGVKAIFLGIVLGSLPTGPLYVAFPIASALLAKGARISCVVAFLSAWACIKIPQELVEWQFMGLRFMLARLVLTIVFVVAMALVVEKAVGGGAASGGAQTG